MFAKPTALLTSPYFSGPGGDTAMPDAEDPVQVERNVPSEDTENTVVDGCDKFRVPKRSFAQQYASIYYARLHALRPGLVEKASNKWGPEHYATNILHLTEGKKTWVIGTLYKEMPLKPSILKELSESRAIVAQAHGEGKRVSPEDTLVLEDDSGRVALVGTDLGSLDIGAVITGGVVAVLGVPMTSGDLQVEEIMMPGLAPQPTPAPASVNRTDLVTIGAATALSPSRPSGASITSQMTMSESSSSARYVAFVSGLRVGDESVNPLLHQLLVDYIGGHVGSPDEVNGVTSRITRVVIAGNSLVASGQSSQSKLKASLNKATTAIAPTHDLDYWLTGLAGSVPVDIIPGPLDPANFTIPQQPLHRALFPVAGKMASFHSLTNPYNMTLDGVEILGSSGQPIDDMRRYVVMDDSLDLLEDTLKYRHMAPTAPDTLGAYPFPDGDPLVMERCPHVAFVANQSAYSTRLLEGPDGQIVRLISIPSFAATGTMVLLDLDTLAVKPVTFGGL